MKSYKNLKVFFVAAFMSWPAWPGVLADMATDCNTVGKRDVTILGCTTILNNIDSSIPDRIRAYVKRGNAYHMNGDYDLAIADFDAALALNPNLTIAYYRRGRTKAAQGLQDAAIADFNSALSRDSMHSFSLYHRGKAKEAKGDVAGALADHQEAVGLNPDLRAAREARDRLGPPLPAPQGIGPQPQPKGKE